jgi:IS4 transposase
MDKTTPTTQNNPQGLTLTLASNPESAHKQSRGRERCKDLIFLTNNLEIPSITVARLYKMRWQIELFFRWIKGHLRIKHYFGTSTNAVKSQIWISVALYLMVAILHKQLQLPGKLHRTFQLLRAFIEFRTYEPSGSSLFSVGEVGKKEG